MKSLFKNILIILFINTCTFSIINAQVGINTDNSNPDASSILDVKSTDKGMLVPRMSATQRDNISTPATGLLVYVNDDNNFYFYNGTSWQTINQVSTPKSITDADSDTKIQVEESADEDIIRFDVGGSERMNLNGGNLNLDGHLHLNQLSPYNSSTGTNAILMKADSDIDKWINFRYGGSSPRGHSGTIFSRFSSNHFFMHNNGTFRLAYSSEPTDNPSIDNATDLLTITTGGEMTLNGQIKINDGNQGSGKILMSDANGLATWTSLSEISNEHDTTQPTPIKYRGYLIYIHPTDNAADVNWATAQSTCDNLTAFGHSDWYLPTRLELDAMYKQSYLIAGLSQTEIIKYWSNTAKDANDAYTQRLDYGGPDPDDKADTNGHNCRCVRKD